jgi:hypothetical protein
MQLSVCRRGGYEHCARYGPLPGGGRLCPRPHRLCAVHRGTKRQWLQARRTARAVYSRPLAPTSPSTSSSTLSSFWGYRYTHASCGHRHRLSGQGTLCVTGERGISPSSYLSAPLSPRYPSYQLLLILGEIVWPAANHLGSQSVHARVAFRPLCSEAYRAAIRALLLGQPPPGIIFSPGRRPPVLVRLQTADHRRRASPVQEEQGATAPCNRTRILRFTVCEKLDAVALVFAYRRRGIFSARLSHQGLLPVLSRLRQTGRGSSRAAGP